MSKSKNKLSVQKLLVGHFIEDLPDDFNKKVAYVWQGNGIWEIRKLPIGTFTTHKQKIDVPGLKSTLEEGWKLNVPKIPATLLDVTLSFFRQIYNKHSSEVFLQFFYDKSKEEYILHCPQQVVGPGSVNYKRDTEYEKGKILVFEIHSHGSMGAFFSGTDDADEKDDRFFGVIGKVKQYYPEMKIRLSVGGVKQDINVEDIFNLDETNYHTESFPLEWINNIKEKKVKVIHRTPNLHRRNRGGVYYPENDYDLYGLDSELCDQLSISEFMNEEKISGMKDEQKLVEHNGKVYIVTNIDDEELWEEIETSRKEEDNEKSQEDFIGHWSDIKW